MKFSVSFQETTYCINGSNLLHITATSDTVPDANNKITFGLKLYSTNGEYIKTWSNILLPNGNTSVTIPFVVPMDWAYDADVVDMNGDNGALSASLSVEYQLTVAGRQYTGNYSGYYARIPTTVDQTILPSVGALSYEVVDGKVPTEWGCLVQGMSVVRISAPLATGAYGSDIYYYYFGNGTAQMQNFTDISLQTAGDITISVTVEDSRGRLKTEDLYLTVEPYQAPSFTQVSSQRCDADGTVAEEGECFCSGGTLTASTLEGRNPATVSVAWKKVTEENYGTPITLAQNAVAIVDANLETGASYDVKYTVQDQFYSIDLYDYLSSTVYLLHFLKGGSGIAVGKAAEQNALFDVALDTTLRRGLRVGGNAEVVGELTLGGIAVKDALQSLQTPLESEFSVNTELFPLSNITENKIVRCGRQLIYSLKATMVGDEPPMAGTTVIMGSIPTGYYSAAFLPQLSALLNGESPCVVQISQLGQVSVVLSQSGQQTIWLSGVGMYLDDE